MQKSVRYSAHLRRSAATSAAIFLCATAYTHAETRLRQQPSPSAQSTPPAGNFLS